MFLTDKHHALLPSHPSKNRRPPHPAPSRASFDAIIAARLRSLLPLLASPLGSLARLADLLALTLADAGPALAATAGAEDAAAVAAHLDAGLALLDACNAIAARLDRLRRRRLLFRFALHLLSSKPSPSALRRARAALADRDDSAAASPPPQLRSLPFDSPRGGLSGAARVILAVNAVSSLAAAAAAAALGGTAPEDGLPRVSGDFPWAEAFNAVSNELAGCVTSAGEIDAVEEAVRKLESVLDGEGDVDEAALRAAVQEGESLTEELTARLDRLSDAVNGVFRAALCLRNAELSRFVVGPTEQKCK